MVSACLISSTMNWKGQDNLVEGDEPVAEVYDAMDGPSEEEAYLQGTGLSAPNSIS